MPFFILICLTLILLTSYSVQRWTGRGAGLLKYDYAWFVGLWLVQMLVLCLPIYDFIESITFKSALFIVAAHFAFACGGMIVMMSSRSSQEVRQSPSNGSSNELFVAVTAIVGGAAQFIITANNIIGSGISISARFNASEFAKARLANFEFNPYFIGSLIGPIMILTALCYISIACFTYSFVRKERWTRRPTIATLAVVAAGAVVIFHQLLVAGGRISVVFIIVLVIASAFIAKSAEPQKGRRRGKAGGAILFTIIFAGAVTGSTLFQQFRGNNADPYMAMLSGHGASVQPYLYTPVRENDLLGNFVLQGSYLTTPPHILSNYLELPDDQQPGPFWGRYNFHAIYRNVARISPDYDFEFWQKDRGELFLPQVRAGRNPNTWATILRDLNGDFGKFGTLIFLFAVGMLAQILADSFYRKRDATKASLMAILRLVFIFSAFHSLLFIGWVVPAILILCGILVQDQVVSGLRGREHGRRPAPVRFGAASQ